MRIVNDGGIQ
ncbi:hypothetical protein YPPY92_2260, partial [Yersinia pestis PY-92]